MSTSLTIQTAKITRPQVEQNQQSTSSSSNPLSDEELSSFKERIFKELSDFLLQELQQLDYKVKPSDFIVDKESSYNQSYPDNVFCGDILIFNKGSIFSQLFKKPIPPDLIQKLVKQFNKVLNLEKRMGLVLCDQALDGYEFYLNAQKEENPNKVRDFLDGQRKLMCSLLDSNN